MVIVLFLASTPKAIACDDAKENEPSDLSWIKCDKPIYATDSTGKLYRTYFSSGKLELIGDHEFIYQGYFKMSPNGRYIVYGSTLKNKTKQVLFVYDTFKNKDTKIFETPRFDIVLLEFSPDSNQLALLNICAPHRQKQEKEGIFIVEMNGFSKTFIPYPASAVIPQIKVQGSELKWSIDGKYLYLAFNGHLDKGHTREYHKFILSSSNYEKSSGYYDDKTFMYNFTENGKEASIHQNPCPQWQCGYKHLKATSCKNEAYVDDEYVLNIIGNGEIHEIERGEYTQCEGITIDILSWLENGKYLIYQISETTYIYGLESKMKAILFDSRIIRFAWHNAGK